MPRTLARVAREVERAGHDDELLRSTPDALNDSTFCVLGTQISSIALHGATQFSGMRSVSNMVRPIATGCALSRWNCGGK